MEATLRGSGSLSRKRLLYYNPSGGERQHGLYLVVIAAFLLAALAAVPVGADHQPMPHDWYNDTDPHDLIGYYTYMTARTNDFDVWEVWICDPISPSSHSSLNRFMAHTPRMVVDWIRQRSQIEQYFAWLSDGKYKPRFRIGGTVTPDMSDHSFSDYVGFHHRREVCADQIISGSDSTHEGLLIVDTNRSFYNTFGTSSAGRRYCTSRDECEPYPIGRRYVYVDGSVWVRTYLHEIGHTIYWPHSYYHDGEEDSNPNQYTNPMDVMSGSVGWVGTTAINRYAAGWIEPADVYVWKLGQANKTVWLDPVGTAGNYQMLVIRDLYDTHYYTFGARVREGFDVHIPKEGVEGYIVDESVDAGCDARNRDWCAGRGRAVHSWGSEPFSADHVLDVGETTEVLLWDGDDVVEVRVSVSAREGGSFKVHVTG